MKAQVVTGGAGTRPRPLSYSPPEQFTARGESARALRPRTTAENPGHHRPPLEDHTRIEAAA
ncbi:hypothetical protein C1708_00535 [Streptomyces sp. DH-12]|uniref:hypothetical protein n=1 Tax=unclassified Streptomyces TaxID=2593676 RepID=UPI000CCDEBA3|nr:hypothetical protein [Streptomyces sp. DH-12]PNV31021.1 hypothetical protein C1708_00535 [Streptomyces sp. DH-12]